MASVVFEEQVEVPLGIHDLNYFRKWVLSDDFPHRGRIDYLFGRIEVDTSPEDLFTHGTLKTEVSGEIKDRVDELDIGHTFCAETRVTSVSGDMSVEPDVVVVSFDAQDAGWVRFVEKATREEGRYFEIDGAVDLIVEFVSDSSETKDTVRLPVAYFAAAVGEFWLIDARGPELKFQIHHRGPDAFEPVPPNDDGYQPSRVLQAHCNLERRRHRRGHWTYRLLMRPE